METKSIPTPHISMARIRNCRDGEIGCIVCNQPVKEAGHKFWVWQHDGGSLVVSSEEGNRLNAEGHEGGDMGLQPVGPTCLKKHPELKPFLQTL